MLKNDFKIKGKVRSAHVLAVLFLLFLFYVAWAGLSDMFIQTGQAMQIRLSPQWFIRQTNELYENMLSTDTQFSFLQNKGTYINLNGFMANALGQPESNEHIKLKNGHLAGIRSDPPAPEEIHSAAENSFRGGRVKVGRVLLYNERELAALQTNLNRERSNREWGCSMH